MMLNNKAKAIRRSISMVLAFVVIFSTLLSATIITSTAAAPTTYTNITVGSSATVNISSSGTQRYYKFVPTQTGSYTFYSSNCTGDPKASLLNASGYELAYNDDGGEGNNFSITYTCTAGTTYYVSAYMYSSHTGSYTLNVRANFALAPEGLVVTAGTYSLFNSGATTSNGYGQYQEPNPAPHTHNNNGYDLKGELGSASSSRFRLGQSFTVATNLTEQAILTVKAWDVDEDAKACGHGYEYDYIYLMDETTGTSTLLDGHMSGSDDTWTNTSFRISPSLLQNGHTYHFEFQMTCTGSSSCSYYAVTVRAVSLLVSDPDPIIDADLQASISSSGVVSTSLTASASDAAVYTVEYKAVYASNGAQRGFKEMSASLSSTRNTFNSSFSLDSGSSRGTYVITAYFKNGSGVVVATRDVTVSYGYTAVSYNSNGGSQNLPVDTTSYSSGQNVTVRFDYIPSRSGYVFLGWSRDSSATTPEFTQNGTNTFTIGSSDVILYAVWREEGPESDIWHGDVDLDFGGGSGTQEDPYHIYTVAQLAYLAQTTNQGNAYEGTYFKLMNDLDLNYIEWTPIGKGVWTDQTSAIAPNFSGVFDGNYHIIRNMVISENDTTNNGLFGVINGATIKNLGNENVDVDVTLSGMRNNCGGIVGTAYDSEIMNCYVTGALTAHSGSISLAGGILGVANNSTISNCWANVTAEAGNAAGGLVGGFYSNSNSRIMNCYAIGTLVRTGASNGVTSSGGVVAYADGGLVENCFFSGTLIGDTYNGIVESRASVNNSYHASNASNGSRATDEQFKTQSWLTDTLHWDFNAVWTIQSSGEYEYPVLRGFDNRNSILCHNPSNWIYDVEPTCLTGGHRYKICTICEEELASESVAPAGHDYAVVHVEEATCTADGYIYMECQRGDCDHSKTQVLVAPGHQFGTDNVCDVCGFVLEMHDHAYSAEVVAPTCLQIGYTLYTCSTCGHEYRADFVDQLGHNWDEGTVITEKTCDTPGVMCYTCKNTDCGATYEVEIPAGHTWTEVVTVEATCLTDGSMTRTCDLCGESEVIVIPAAHDWDDGLVLEAPTCTEPGTKLCTCHECQQSAELQIPALGHHFVNGFCTRCGASISDIVSPDSQHPEYGMYFEIDDIISGYGPAYINEYGVYLDYNRDASIQKVGVYLTQEGTMWRRCIACVGDGITYATYVPYLSYNGTMLYTGLNSDWINIFRLSENNSGIWCYSDYATIGVNLQDAQGNLLLSLYDIGQAGAKTRVFDDLDEMIAWLSADNDCVYHTAGEWTVVVEPGCGTQGLRESNCTLCGTRFEEVLPATGEHIESEWIIDIAPTALSTGCKHTECVVCGAVVSSEIIDMLSVIKLEDIVVRSGSTVAVTMDIQNNPGIIGAVLTLEYDPALTLVDVLVGGAWSLLDIMTPGNYAPPCTFVWDGLDQADYADGTIITLIFEVPVDAVSGTVYNITASYEDGNLVNAQYENADVVIEGGSITVEELLGDVNNDGIIDIADTIALRRYLSSGYEIDINLAQADINEDGQITIMDVILLRRYITNGSI